MFCAVDAVPWHGCSWNPQESGGAFNQIAMYLRMATLMIDGAIRQPGSILEVQTTETRFVPGGLGAEGGAARGS